MQYGDWQLRDDSVYYNSQNVLLYPSSNSADEGSIHLETNVRSIVRRITTKSYKLSDNDFHVTLDSDGKTVFVSSGQANIQGYHLITNKSLSIKVPVTTSITPYTLGISLSYDGSNNVTGDVVTFDGDNNEFFSGAFLKFFDECNVQHNYDNILVLARIWVKDGSVVSKVTDENGRYIENGIENDPFNDHAIKSSNVEVTVNGVERNQYDTMSAIRYYKSYVDDLGHTQTAHIITSNITDTSKYESMYYEVEHNPQFYTKAPTFTTDIQDVINYLPDWYVSKYGDYMTGGLRFEMLSTDAKIELDPDHADDYRKDCISGTGIYHNKFGVLISPRAYGSLAMDTSQITDQMTVEAMFANGGTIMSVAPDSYKDGLDTKRGDAGIFAMLSSSWDDDTGLTIRRTNDGPGSIASKRGNYTRLVSVRDIENVHAEMFEIMHSKDLDDKLSSITFRESDVYIESYHDGNIQISVKPEITGYSNHTVFSRYAIKYGIGVIDNQMPFNMTEPTYDTGTSTLVKLSTTASIPTLNGLKNEDDNTYYPALDIGSLRLQSYIANQVLGTYAVTGQYISSIGITPTINTSFKDNYAVFDTTKPNRITFLEVTPGTYSPKIISEDYIIVGTDKTHNIISNEAFDNTFVKTFIGRTRSNASYTDANRRAVIEQTYREDGYDYPVIFNKVVSNNMKAVSSDSDKYECINGVYSKGNIGCSNYSIQQYKGETDDLPYNNAAEWVRFTQYRYDKDNDKQYLGGMNSGNTTGNHERRLGNPFNIEFNTTVANVRSNQIIWNFKGSQDVKHQPLTLSYIHDEKTDYPNSEYYDENLNKHQNPTYGVRDFLRIDGGGLSIHGDVNNPTLAGDNNNEINHLGITLVHGRVYSASYNDYAETYEKADPMQEAIPGMVVMLDPETEKYKICDEPESNLVVGVISNNYGMLIGGQTIQTVEDQQNSINQLCEFHIGVSGKVPVIIDGDVKPGDLLVSSDIKGHARSITFNYARKGTVLGKALSKPYEDSGYKKCMMQIMLA